MRHFLLILCVFAACSSSITTTEIPSIAEAEKLETGSATFQIPEKIRGRVGFWASIYSKYGEFHRVVHHRMYPQAVFAVLDFYDAAKRMSAVELAKHIEATELQMKNKINAVMDYFADGEMPRNSFERQIYQAMGVVPGGQDKFARVVREDLVRTQTGIKERFREAITRSGKYLPMMEKIFIEQGLPREIARLPFVESSFDYRVVSSVGASGLWQFMKRTGKEFGMQITPAVDERRDPLIATRAAAQYLKSAYRRLDSWPLAITSYNHGVAGIARKVKDLGTRDLSQIIEHPDVRPLGFASNNFYPCFLAALAVYHDAQRLFPGIKTYSPLQFNEKKFGRSLKANEVAKLTGSSLDELKDVNYALDSKVWEGRFPIPAWYSVKIPSTAGKVRNVVEESPLLPPAEAKNIKPAKVFVQKKKSDVPSKKIEPKKVYVVKKGDTLSAIARKYGTSEKVLSGINKGRKDIKTGEKLQIP